MERPELKIPEPDLPFTVPELLDALILWEKYITATKMKPAARESAYWAATQVTKDILNRFRYPLKPENSDADRTERTDSSPERTNGGSPTR